jgi:hypothetical protein
VIALRLRRPDAEQRKLLFSLGTNFLTRIPGAVGVLWFLPLLHFGLGTDDYASLLSSLALGSAAAILAAGFSLVGRRLIGEAYGNGDRQGEANAFASLVVANAAALCLALAIVAAYWSTRGIGTAALAVATIPAFAAFLNTFDNVRMAYNEHYVTAMLQLVLQVTIYGIGFSLPATRHNLILGAVVLQGHYLAASLITLALLVRNRPYLIGGRPIVAWRVARDGTLLAIADGCLMATLSLSVVWLQNSASTTASAWFATMVRLFQTLLVPVILLLTPLSSYVRLLWNAKSVAQQQTFTMITLWIGLGYGAIVAVALLVASRLYVGGALNLPEPGSILQILPIFLLFAAIVAYRAYSSIAYLVLQETAHLASWTTAATGTSVVLAAAASFALDPLSVINVYALAAALPMVVILFWNAARFVRLPPTLPADLRQ